jgi:hypothetical protein
VGKWRLMEGVPLVEYDVPEFIETDQVCRARYWRSYIVLPTPSASYCHVCDAHTWHLDGFCANCSGEYRRIDL